MWTGERRTERPDVALSIDLLGPSRSALFPAATAAEGTAVYTGDIDDLSRLQGRGREELVGRLG